MVVFLQICLFIWLEVFVPISDHKYQAKEKYIFIKKFNNHISICAIEVYKKYVISFRLKTINKPKMQVKTMATISKFDMVESCIDGHTSKYTMQCTLHI